MRADHGAQVAGIDIHALQHGLKGLDGGLHLLKGVGVAEGYAVAEVRLGVLKMLEQGLDDVLLAADAGNRVHLALLDLDEGLDAQQGADEGGGT